MDSETTLKNLAEKLTVELVRMNNLWKWEYQIYGALQSVLPFLGVGSLDDVETKFIGDENSFYKFILFSVASKSIIFMLIDMQAEKTVYKRDEFFTYAKQNNIPKHTPLVAFFGDKGGNDDSQDQDVESLDANQKGFIFAMAFADFSKGKQVYAEVDRFDLFLPQWLALFLTGLGPLLKRTGLNLRGIKRRGFSKYNPLAKVLNDYYTEQQ